MTLHASSSCTAVMSGYFDDVHSIRDFSAKSIGYENVKRMKYIGFNWNSNREICIDSEFPVGCRDIMTFMRIRRHKPDSYVSLCHSLLASQLDIITLNDVHRNQIVFVDCDESFIQNTKRCLRLKDSNITRLTNWIKHNNRT